VAFGQIAKKGKYKVVARPIIYITLKREREREAAGAGVAPIQKSTSDLHVL
jgi:hypothetical protein